MTETEVTTRFLAVPPTWPHESHKTWIFPHFPLPTSTILPPASARFFSCGTGAQTFWLASFDPLLSWKGREKESESGEKMWRKKEKRRTMFVPPWDAKAPIQNTKQAYKVFSPGQGWQKREGHFSRSWMKGKINFSRSFIACKVWGCFLPISFIESLLLIKVLSSHFFLSLELQAASKSL